MRKYFTKPQQKMIEESCAAHAGRIAPQDFGLAVRDGILEPVMEGCTVCALGAVALDHKVPVTYYGGHVEARSFAAFFGVDEKTIFSFTRGFDYEPFKKGVDYPGAYILGKRLRDESILS